jgi:hypothetical protein
MGLVQHLKVRLESIGALVVEMGVELFPILVGEVSHPVRGPVDSGQLSCADRSEDLAEGSGHGGRMP